MEHLIYFHLISFISCGSLAFFVDRGEGHAQIQARDGLQVVVRPCVMRVVLQVEVPLKLLKQE